MGLFSTAHITYRFHPLHIAKFGATIDHISNGRWGLNIVSGYSAKEMAAFGFKQPIGHDEAYDMADEFVCLMKHLWHEEERFDFEGKYYQAYGAIVAPRPTRRPRPILMNAGASERGLDFGARHSDWIFATMPDLPAYAERINHIHTLAAKYGRKVRCATMIWVLPDATDELASRKYEWIESEIDKPAVLNFLASRAHLPSRFLVRAILKMRTRGANRQASICVGRAWHHCASHRRKLSNCGRKTTRFARDRPRKFPLLLF